MIERRVPDWDTRSRLGLQLNEPKGCAMDFSGKTAIVTGAASGIGLGIATALAEVGANVVLADIQNDALEQAAHGLSGTNKRVMPVSIDVTQEQSVRDALAAAERHFGKLHIACNNPGCRCTAPGWSTCRLPTGNS
jgi:NAD(P)-dependent dehydrogenase (short-subunit alcohol dehydrogenase family)